MCKKLANSEEEWYQQYGVTHAHCPNGCEHPQPIMLENGCMVCGRCLVCFGEVILMDPCNC